MYLVTMDLEQYSSLFYLFDFCFFALYFCCLVFFPQVVFVIFIIKPLPVILSLYFGLDFVPVDALF